MSSKLEKFADLSRTLDLLSNTQACSSPRIEVYGDDMSDAALESNLLTLPAELRERIYCFYFANGTAGRTDRPQEPPLLYVSNTIRSETLPIYYSEYTLTIQSYVKCDFYGHAWVTTRKWYHGIHPDKLRNIERFRVRFILVQQYTGELVPLEFQLSPHTRSCNYSLSHSFDRAWIRNPHRTGDPADFEEVLQVLKVHLLSTIENLVNEPGIGNWTAVDLDRLARVDPDSLPLQTVS